MVATGRKGTDLHHIVFENADRQRVAILTNTGAPRVVSLQIAGSIADIALPAESISTVVWS
jgi:O-glycosyl hydrolase